MDGEEVGPNLGFEDVKSADDVQAVRAQVAKAIADRTLSPDRAEVVRGILIDMEASFRRDGVMGGNSAE